jgi:hypothetical protein
VRKRLYGLMIQDANIAILTTFCHINCEMSNSGTAMCVVHLYPISVKGEGGVALLGVI